MAGLNSIWNSKQISYKTKLTAHIDHLTATCSSSFYAIRKLKTHGLSSSSIHNVTKATTVAKLLYASPSWWGLTLASDKERLEKLLKRAKRLGYLEQSFPTVSELANIADAKLLFSILHNPKAQACTSPTPTSTPTPLLSPIKT